MPDIEKNVTIAAPIEKVWAALTDEKAISGWMGGAVKVELKKGGRYKFFGGDTTGAFTEIKKPDTLEYTWRQNEWNKEWPDSVVRWELKEVKGGTKARLTHKKFPNKEERDGHDEGWDSYWLAPMKAWLET
jgi:uncharacterized protein YndB with AHSA1/START domain